MQRLENTVQETPLTVELLQEFYYERVGKVIFTRWFADGRIVWIPEKGYRDKPGVNNAVPGKFQVTIDPALPIDEQAVTLIHEAMHGIYETLTYRYGSPVFNNQKAEDLFESAAQKFYAQHSREALEILDELKRKY